MRSRWRCIGATEDAAREREPAGSSGKESLRRGLVQVGDVGLRSASFQCIQG